MNIRLQTHLHYNNCHRVLSLQKRDKNMNFMRQADIFPSSGPVDSCIPTFSTYEET